MTHDTRVSPDYKANEYEVRCSCGFERGGFEMSHQATEVRDAHQAAVRPPEDEQ